MAGRWATVAISQGFQEVIVSSGTRLSAAILI
jgi:hypothetical protein